MYEPTHLDLFSGIGGFALAAGRAGFRTIGFSEIDPYASAVLRKHWPDVPNLITGGFPCQPFSLAGKRAGAGDDRFLWPSMLDVIRRCRPAWVLGENVPGLIGMELDRVLADLEGLGFRTVPLVVPACAVDARHRRDRVWIIANAESQRRRERRPESISARETEPCGNCETLAHANGSGRRKRRGPEPIQPEHAAAQHAGKDVSDTTGGQRNGGELRVGRRGEGEGEGEGDRSVPAQWAVEPELGRVAHGIPRRVDRLKGLGNAIVPQVAEVILQEIHRQIISTQ